MYTFGDVHPDPVSGEVTSPGQRIRDVLERIRLVEEVGLDYVGIGEHHRPDYAISSPSTVIAAALAQTSRITVGSAVTVLSTEDPVRVYQQFATMDLLSQGRVELLAGRGSFIESYPLFGASLDDYDELYDEKIQLLLQLDAAERVTWSGRFRPPLDDALVLPRPFDHPGRGQHLTIAVATGGNPQSSIRAGRARPADQLRDHRRPAGVVRAPGRPLPPRPRAVRARRVVAVRVGRRHGLLRRGRQGGARLLLPVLARVDGPDLRRARVHRCPTGSRTSRRPRAAAPTSSASRSRSPSGSSPCTRCCTTTASRSRWTCPVSRSSSR